LHATPPLYYPNDPCDYNFVTCLILKPSIFRAINTTCFNRLLNDSFIWLQFTGKCTLYCGTFPLFFFILQSFPVILIFEIQSSLFLRFANIIKQFKYLYLSDKNTNCYRDFIIQEAGIEYWYITEPCYK